MRTGEDGSRKYWAEGGGGLTKVCNGARKARLISLSYFCVARPLIPTVRPPLVLRGAKKHNKQGKD
jgi:hypothetical protein